MGIDPDYAGRCFGRTFSRYPLGTLLIPMVGGYLVEQGDMRFVFILAIFFILCLFSLFLLVRLPKDIPHATSARTSPLFTWEEAYRSNYLEITQGFDLGRIGIMGSAAALGAVTLNWLFGQISEQQPWVLFASLLTVFCRHSTK